MLTLAVIMSWLCTDYMVVIVMDSEQSTMGIYWLYDAYIMVDHPGPSSAIRVRCFMLTNFFGDS